MPAVPLRFLLALVILCAGCAARAELVIRDDSGQTLRLAHPAQRIVSVAPHATENLFAIGAGGRLVGAVDFSDYPQEAKRIRRFGSSERVDFELLLSLKPDLVIVWGSGTPAPTVAKLRALGLAVYVSEPERIQGVAPSLERLGKLTGAAPQAHAVAERFRARLADLQRRYGSRPPVRVFYEIWNQPLMTVGRRQIISDGLRVCGGENVFAGLSTMAAPVSVESVLAADPEAIVAATEAGPNLLDDWKRWPQLTAVARNNLFAIPPDIMHRHTPRILDGTERVCGFLETARSHRPASK